MPATYLSSQQGVRERRAVMAELGAAAPTCKLLYVTPEQLVKSGELVDALRRLARHGLLARLVVDEARQPLRSLPLFRVRVMFICMSEPCPLAP